MPKTRELFCISKAGGQFRERHNTGAPPGDRRVGEEQPGESRTLLHGRLVTPGVSVKMFTFVHRACTRSGGGAKQPAAGTATVTLRFSAAFPRCNLGKGIRICTSEEPRFHHGIISLRKYFRRARSARGERVHGRGRTFALLACGRRCCLNSTNDHLLFVQDLPSRTTLSPSIRCLSVYHHVHVCNVMASLRTRLFTKQHPSHPCCPPSLPIIRLLTFTDNF